MAIGQDFQIGDTVFFVKLVRRNIPTIALGDICGFSPDAIIITHGWATWVRPAKNIVKVDINTGNLAQNFHTAREELRKRWTERNL